MLKKTKAQYSKIKAVKLDSPIIIRFLLGTIILLLLKIFFKIDILLIGMLLSASIFNSLLQNFQLRRGLPTDFELSTFTTIIITLKFGIFWGIINAILSKLVACVYTGSILADHFFMIATYINAAILVVILKNFIPHIIILGFFIVIINCILMFFISKNILGIDITANMSYTITNLVFNSLVLLTLIQPLKFILGL